MSSQGGDVFKFAGDAILVVWPPSDEDLTTLTRRAGQCALEIKDKLQDVKFQHNITLSVKIGVGVGEISILHIGGVFGRMEYCATGT
jgi:class 3 adenylate cyclase